MKARDKKRANRIAEIQKKIPEMKKTRDAAAVKYSEEEKQQVITGKKIQFIEIQKLYRADFLDLQQLYLEMNEMARQIDLEKATKGSITLLWLGAPCPVGILELWHDKKVNLHAQTVASFLMGKERLKNYGLTEKQIETLKINAKYIKDLPDEKQPAPQKKDKVPDYVG